MSRKLTSEKCDLLRHSKVTCERAEWNEKDNILCEKIMWRKRVVSSCFIAQHNSILTKMCFTTISLSCVKILVALFHLVTSTFSTFMLHVILLLYFFSKFMMRIIYLVDIVYEQKKQLPFFCEISTITLKVMIVRNNKKSVKYNK
jgi:hypothetical protein